MYMSICMFMCILTIKCYNLFKNIHLIILIYTPAYMYIATSANLFLKLCMWEIDP